MIGGEQARRAIVQCDRLGFSGEIWPVNPNRKQMESRVCFPSVEDLPQIPDAAFIAVPSESTVETVRYLEELGTGGVVCYASGFAEVGIEGRLLQHRLELSAKVVPLVGPNCYGMINYQDGAALWPDEQGAQRCQRGVAIISQSGNISLNFTMQQRGLPVAYLFSTGNMAGLKTHEYIHAMLDNPDITAIGLYLEQIPDAYSLSEVAIKALERNVPIVVLASGYSKVGADVTLTHSYSMSGDRELSKAFFDKFGIIQVHSIPQLLETLKFVSVLTPVADRSIASISCSGGEAALTADLAEQHDLEFTGFSSAQQSRLFDILGSRVVISNPLDYHTYIWGQQQAQIDCFQTVFEGEQALTLKVFDYPTQGLCDTTEWDYAVEAIIDAKNAADARVAVVSTLHENFSIDRQKSFIENGIAPMLGLQECMQAISDSIKFANACRNAGRLAPLSRLEPDDGNPPFLFSEFRAKQMLGDAGVRIVPGAIATNVSEAIEIAASMSYPVVAKTNFIPVLHKSEVGGVKLNIDSDECMEEAIRSLSPLGESFLIEKMAPEPTLELLVGIRRDPQFGRVMVIGAGGKLAELFNDIAILFFPVKPVDVKNAFAKLRIGQLMSGFRDIQVDVDSVTSELVRIADYAADIVNNVEELEINPLFVYQEGDPTLVVDLVLRKIG